MKHKIAAAIALALLVGTASAKERTRSGANNHSGDRVCTAADVVRFEAMLGGIRSGQYRTDPRFAVTVHYLGTTIVNGTCNIALRPAD
jgi:hypothetical protein